MASVLRRPVRDGVTASALTCLLLQVAMIVFSIAILPSQCQSDLIDVYVTEGQNKMLECRFNPQFATRNTVYYWTRSNKNEQDNVAIGDQSLDNHYKVELDTNDGKYRLFISNTSYVNDNGKFQCKVKETGTGMGFHVQVFRLIVLSIPGPPMIRSSLAIATEGQQFQLTCSSVGGSPDPDIKWYREGDSSSLETLLQPGGSKDKPTLGVLAFNPSKEDDGVKFTCAVNNKALEHDQMPKLEDFVKLEVNYVPRVTIHPKSPLKVEKNSVASASCRVDSKPEPISIKWTHGGRLVANGAHLNIKISSLEDAGSYVCSADNGLGISGQAELLIDVLHEPIIQMESKREANENEDVVVQCNVSANPPAKIHWFKEGDPAFIAKGSILQLAKINSKSMGRYTCEASNELFTSLSHTPIRRTANATVSIWIKHKPGNTVIYPENAVGVEGKPLNLMCSAYPPGWPEPRYRWWKDVPSHALPSSQNYTINQARNNNEGRYFCQAYNELGEGNVATLDLKIYEPPHLLTALESPMIKRTSDSGLALTCEARAKPHPSVRWLKNGQSVHPSGINEITTTEAKEGNGAYLVKSVLKFSGPERLNYNQLTIDDGGIYTCEFDNSVVDPIGSNTTLKIEHGPILRHTMRKVAFDTMTKAVLECRMQAYPAPTFEWSFQNTVITSGLQQYKINQTELINDVSLSTLVIQQVHVNDYGEYTCSAANIIDSAKTHIRLVPRGPPEIPTNLHAVNITDNSVELQWTNGFNGGYEDTIYLVSYWSSGVPKLEKECISSGCFIGGLEEMTDYYFNIQSQNVQGSSELSNEIVVETKIGINNIPHPVNVYFNQDNSELYFEVVPTKLELIGKVEVWNGEWIDYMNNLPISSKESRLKLDVAPYSNNGLKVSLCLKNNTILCGQAVDAAPGSPPSLVTANMGPSPLIISVAIACGIAVLIILGCAFYCCRRRNNYKDEKIKKDYEMEASNARPKAITAPYYPEGIVNKGVDSPLDHDDTNKHPSYGTPMNNQHGHDHSVPGHHISNGNMPPGYGYLDREFSNSNGGSVDSQDSLWLKTNGEVNNDRGYTYDPSLSNAYLYPEDYHHVHEDIMNQRNRDHLYNSDPYGPVKAKKRNDHLNDVFHDVSGMPDPYMEEEEKMPHHSISFDESLESGYSTPNSRSRRVIREIIV